MVIMNTRGSFSRLVRGVDRGIFRDKGVFSMIEYKFRAWFSDLSARTSAILVDTFFLKDLRGSINFEGDPDEEHVCVTPRGFDIKDALFVDEFTGVRDSKGREIFEGDFLECQGNRWAVIFNENKLAFEAINRNHGAYDYLWMVSDYLGIEVVGNIHENPELAWDALKDVKERRK